MSDDLLERATRALREESRPSAADLTETRARLLASSRTTTARRVRAVRWVLPLAAAFAAGTAFAATNGQLERAVRAVQTWLVEAPAAPASTPSPKPRRARPARPDSVATSPDGTAPLPVEPTPTLVPPAEPAPSTDDSAQVAAAAVRGAQNPAARSARATPPVPVVSEPLDPAGAPESPAESADSTTSEPSAEPVTAAPSQAPARAPNPDLALYREAHQAHFASRSFGQALALWDRYLERYPSGIFAVEARYNRAICLLRLGKKGEAERALLPFAEGQAPGAYRRDEARALLEALHPKP